MTTSRSSRRPILLATAAAVALLSASAIAPTAATAAQPANSSGIGTGRAVVHVDSAQATVAKQADGTYVLTLPKSATGQWMGQRTNAKGKTKVLVGKLTAARLASGWSNFRYTSSGVNATLVWNGSSDTPDRELVHVGQPKVTDTGVSFVVTSAHDFPATLDDVSLNLARAPKKSMRTTYPSLQTENLASDLWISLNNSDDEHATARIYNSTNNNTCFSKTMDNNNRTFSVGTNTCDNITYTNYVNSNVVYGVSSDFPDGASVGEPPTGNTSFNLVVTPPGQAAYHYDYMFTWTA